MKYVIDKNNDNMRLMYYSVNMVGLNVNPKNEVPGLKIKAKKRPVGRPVVFIYPNDQ